MNINQMWTVLMKISLRLPARKRGVYPLSNPSTILTWTHIFWVVFLALFFFAYYYKEFDGEASIRVFVIFWSCSMFYSICCSSSVGDNTVMNSSWRFFNHRIVIQDKKWIVKAGKILCNKIKARHSGKERTRKNIKY